jgi:hypothetical protein
MRAPVISVHGKDDQGNGNKASTHSLDKRRRGLPEGKRRLIAIPRILLIPVLTTSAETAKRSADL